MAGKGGIQAADVECKGVFTTGAVDAFAEGVGLCSWHREGAGHEMVSVRLAQERCQRGCGEWFEIVGRLWGVGLLQKFKVRGKGVGGKTLCGGFLPHGIHQEGVPTVDPGLPAVDPSALLGLGGQEALGIAHGAQRTARCEAVEAVCEVGIVLQRFVERGTRRGEVEGFARRIGDGHRGEAAQQRLLFGGEVVEVLQFGVEDGGKTAVAQPQRERKESQKERPLPSADPRGGRQRFRLCHRCACCFLPYEVRQEEDHEDDGAHQHGSGEKPQITECRCLQR